MHDIGIGLGWLLLASAVLVLTATVVVVYLYRLRAAKRFKKALNVYALREMAGSPTPLKGSKRTKAFSTR